MAAAEILPQRSTAQVGHATRGAALGLLGFAQQSKGSIIVDILITYTAPASTKLQVTEDVLVLHKCLTDDTPGSGN